MENIIYIIKEYLAMKEHYKEYNEENLYNVFTIFANEVFELCDTVSDMDFKINSVIEEGFLPLHATLSKVNEGEEFLLNEIADVLLTTARLIKEFKLEEPLIEMLEYKFHRQLTREEKIKNEFNK